MRAHNRWWRSKKKKKVEVKQTGAKLVLHDLTNKVHNFMSLSKNKFS